MAVRLEAQLVAALQSADFSKADTIVVKLIKKHRQNPRIQSRFELVRIQLKVVRGDKKGALNALESFESNPDNATKDTQALIEILKLRLGQNTDQGFIQKLKVEEIKAALEENLPPGSDLHTPNSNTDLLANNLKNSIDMQLGWLLFQQGQIHAAITQFSELIQKATDRHEIAIAQLMISTGLEKADRLESALISADRSRKAAVAVKNPTLYTLAATSMTRLYLRMGDHANALKVALIARRSLPAIHANEEADGFQMMLDLWKKTWPEKTWNAAALTLKSSH